MTKIEVSPNTSSVVSAARATKIRDVEIKPIIDAYAKINIDVLRFFENLESISIYRCDATGLEYYHPKSLAGDGMYYEQMQSIQNYYMATKWEFFAVIDLIRKEDRVLEIGSGRGDFLSLIKDKCRIAIGLELNNDASVYARNKGIDVRSEGLKEFAPNNQNSFDVVCSFQVMEHVPDVESILQDSILALRDGGKLIISVPNNDSFVGRSESILNKPPHHMNLWTKNSLENLANYYPLKLEAMILENLQPQHYFAACTAMITSRLKPSIFRRALISMIRISRVYKLAAMLSTSIVGHSIIAVFTKHPYNESSPITNDH